MALLLTHVGAGVWRLLVAAFSEAWGWVVDPKRVVRREQQREAREADRLAHDAIVRMPRVLALRRNVAKHGRIRFSIRTGEATETAAVIGQLIQFK
jgi:hypothetical protein